MPPPSRGRGARRVQSTAPSGVGSPDATPSEKGYDEKVAWASARRSTSGAATLVTPIIQASRSNSRRDRREINESEGRARIALILRDSRESTYHVPFRGRSGQSSAQRRSRL